MPFTARTLVAATLVASPVAALLAFAAVEPGTKCEADKLKAAGVYASCR